MSELSTPLEDIYFFWLDRANKAKKRATARLFGELGIDLNVDQWVIIKRLSEAPGLTQKALSEHTLKDPAALTRSLDLLEAEGFVERRPSPDDRRTTNLFLTDSGQDIISRVLPRAVEGRRQGLEGISAEDLQVFRKVIHRMTENFEKM